MQPEWRERPEARGMCQCGAVRYAIAPGPARETICSCRMCQRASGNAFAPLYEVATARVSWTGTPATWASSDIAERGFCATCGTPLFYRETAGDVTEFMAGTLSPAASFQPTAHTGTASLRPWILDIAAIHRRAADGARAVQSRQAPES